MSRTTPRPTTPPATPRVAQRAAVGVSVVLLALYSLTPGPGEAAGRPPAMPEQVGLRLDPGVATREELMLLPRVGPVIADYIVAYREGLSPARAFRCADDLENVHRIGPVTVEQLRPYLRFPRTQGAGRAEAALP